MSKAETLGDLGCYNAVNLEVLNNSLLLLSPRKKMVILGEYRNRVSQEDMHWTELITSVDGKHLIRR